MAPELWTLYGHMLRSRLFEEAVIQLWGAGQISGEMHLGIGEEAIAAGIIVQLEAGDAMALDHRGTPPMLVRGVDPVLLLCEFLGRPDGLCSGMGGHMHLFSPQHLAASSGIVGASGPASVGFALAAQHLRPENMAVAFFGEGAMNQGMMLEAMNLAVVWKLPVIFVCKDNGWAVTTRSPFVTGGNLVDRATSFGLPALEVDGSDVQAVWHAAHELIERARGGGGPAFLQAHCSRLQGHFLGDPLMRISRKEVKPEYGPLLRSAIRIRGASIRERVRSLGEINALIRQATQDHLTEGRDPLEQARQKLKADATRLEKLEQEVRHQIRQAVEKALLPVG